MKRSGLVMSMAAVGLGMAMAFAQAAAPAGGPGGGAPGGGGRGGRGGGGGGGAPVAASQWAHSPVADGAKPVALATGFLFTEGATSDAAGDIYFVDQQQTATDTRSRIMKWEFEGGADPLKGRVVRFMEPSGFANGMCFDKDGNLIVCADERNELWSIKGPLPKVAATGPASTKPFTRDDLKVEVLIKDYNGKLMNGPNDVWCVPTGPLAGGMYITDPLYGRPWWGELRPKNDRTMQQPGKYAYYMAPDHKTIKPVVTDFNTPNGIIGTPDGKTLYVSDISAGQTFQYTIKDDGTLADKKLLFSVGSDGMTIDSDGNLYTTQGNAGQGLKIWDKTGQQIGQIPIGCANCCFGGKDGDILFICSSTTVYGVKMKTHKVGPQ